MNISTRNNIVVVECSCVWCNYTNSRTRLAAQINQLKVHTYQTHTHSHTHNSQSDSHTQTASNFCWSPATHPLPPFSCPPTTHKKHHASRLFAIYIGWCVCVCTMHIWLWNFQTAPPPSHIHYRNYHIVNHTSYSCSTLPPPNRQTFLRPRNICTRVAWA